MHFFRKFGAVTIENPETSDQSVLTFRLFIDGKESWSSVLLSPLRVSGKGWGRKDALWG
jgi:alkaline phosphatase D